MAETAPARVGLYARYAALPSGVQMIGLQL
ncbi:hypothetical protein J2S43_001495 [Catenuloplanes nepalensis]|uniref:Uncharacterized protein n=1 Tax=Catenuloplanes nepalensis TaxID=587533 RepID=A0ABT9MNF6_9ACTN|nr:hypothetical protein [Catenuloplanes nepalensis]